MKFLLRVLKPYLTALDEQVIAYIVANKDTAVLAATASGVSSEKFAVDFIIKAITDKVPVLASFAPFFIPQLETAASALVANGTKDVGPLIDALVAFLRKEEAYL